MTAKVWWMIRKDLTSECRARRAWPAMLLLGIVVAVVFAVQMDLLPDQRTRIVGGLLWLAVVFAGTLALDRALGMEREEGCGQGLLLYPVSPAAVFLAKLAVSVVALAALEIVLIPLFVVLSGVPLLENPWAMAVVAGLGTLGIAAVGTPMAALAAKMPERSGLTSLLVFPMVIPVLLAAAEATRLVAENDLGAAWWRWVQFLAVYAVVFIVSGTALFSFVAED